MDQPLHSYMRPGIVLCVAFPEAVVDGEALARALEAIAQDDFFSAVEVRYTPDDRSRDHMTEVLSASRLDVLYELHPRMQASTLDLNSADDALRARAVATAKDAIDEAIAVGAVRINMASGADPGPDGRDPASETLVDVLYELIGYTASKGGPCLALEPYPRRGSAPSLVGPAGEGIELVRLVREVYPGFELTLDSGYMAVEKEDITATLTAAAPYLGQVHLANVAPGTAGAALPFGAAGGVYGAPQVADFLLTLFRVGFLGAGRRPFVVLRVAPLPGERPEWVVAGAKRTLAEAWTRL